MPRRTNNLQEIQNLSANQEVIQPQEGPTFYDANITATIDTTTQLTNLTGIPLNYLNIIDDTYSLNNIQSSQLTNYQDNTITFFNNRNNWVMKIQENEILFNTEQLTIDEITKIFLQRLEQLTHKEGLQYTFNF